MNADDLHVYIEARLNGVERSITTLGEFTQTQISQLRTDMREARDADMLRLTELNAKIEKILGYWIVAMVGLVGSLAAELFQVLKKG